MQDIKNGVLEKQLSRNGKWRLIDDYLMIHWNYTSLVLDSQHTDQYLSAV
jgi:hypothetical protein